MINFNRIYDYLLSVIILLFFVKFKNMLDNRYILLYTVIQEQR